MEPRRPPSWPRRIYREGSKVVAAGANPMDVKRGIDMAVEEVVKELKKLSKPIKDQKEISQVGNDLCQ